MSADISTLTDKEKEALRLLLEGHDTKSSANLLGLSVHTINDRLRNARRKIGVGSSREAARILRDAEGETPQITPQNAPQNPAHTSFGMSENTATSDTAVLNQTHRKEPNRLIWLAGGMLIMSIVIAAAIIAMVSNSGEEPVSPGDANLAATESAVETPQSATQADAVDASPAALRRARNFINAIDGGNWQSSWDRAGEFFQSQAGVDEWTALVEPVRQPLGAVTERRLVSVQRAQTLPGAPEGDYEILQYQTKFENVEIQSTETVIMIRNGDDFDVAGYFIR